MDLRRGHGIVLVASSGANENGAETRHSPGSEASAEASDPGPSLHGLVV